jgi:hypothetical protein
MHEEPTATYAFLDRAHYFLEFMVQNWPGICNGNMGVVNLYGVPYRVLTQRDHGSHSRWIAGCKFFRIFEIAEVEPFPDMRHSLSRSSFGMSESDRIEINAD